MKCLNKCHLENSSIKNRIAGWITLRVVVAVILFLITLFIFVTITDEIVLEHESGFDGSIANAILSLNSPLATTILEGFTFFGSSSFLLPAYSLLVLYYLVRKKWKLALDVSSIGITSIALLYFLKVIFKRDRPADPLIQHVTGFSYPSGHSFSSFTFCGVMAYLVWQTKIDRSWKIAISIILFLFATTIALSRVYLRVHYPSDVVAGFCLSIIWLILSLWILKMADKKFFQSQGPV